MALSVDYIFEFAKKLVRKSQAGGLTSNEFQQYWNEAQSGYINDLVGPFQKRSNDPSNPRVGLMQNQSTLTKLSPVMGTSSLSVVSGSANKPDNFVYLLDLRIGTTKVQPISFDQWESVSGSVIDTPSASTGTYFYSEYNNAFEFLPSTLTATATLKYIFMPENIVWAYTLDADGRQVYDSANSVQPVWDDVACREITMRMLKPYGVSIKDGDFQNAGQSAIITGQ